MPRSNWKGFVSFGLVNIPIILYSSEDTAEKITFHQIDKRDFARIKYQRVNAETGKEVPWKHIIKGYQYDKETIIPVEEGELEKVMGEEARTIAIDSFVPEESIQFIDIDKTYYLVPDKKRDKGYVILREALKKSKKIGIAKVIISSKDYVAAVACYENALVLYLLRYQEEIRPVSEFDIPSNRLKDYKVTTKEIQIANQLIQSMSSKWKPEQYKDEFHEMVHEWAENKVKHKRVTKTGKKSHVDISKKGVNFIDLLKKSLSEAKKSKSPRKTKSKMQIKKKPSHGRSATLH